MKWKLQGDYSLNILKIISDKVINLYKIYTLYVLINFIINFTFAALVFHEILFEIKLLRLSYWDFICLAEIWFIFTLLIVYSLFLRIGRLKKTSAVNITTQQDKENRPKPWNPAVLKQYRATFNDSTLENTEPDDKTNDNLLEKPIVMRQDVSKIAPKSNTDKNSPRFVVLHIFALNLEWENIKNNCIYLILF